MQLMYFKRFLLTAALVFNGNLIALGTSSLGDILYNIFWSMPILQSILKLRPRCTDTVGPNTIELPFLTDNGEGR